MSIKIYVEGGVWQSKYR